MVAAFADAPELASAHWHAMAADAHRADRARKPAVRPPTSGEKLRALPFRTAKHHVRLAHLDSLCDPSGEHKRQRGRQRSLRTVEVREEAHQRAGCAAGGRILRTVPMVHPAPNVYLVVDIIVVVGLFLTTGNGGGGRCGGRAYVCEDLRRRERRVPHELLKRGRHPSGASKGLERGKLSEHKR